MPKPREGYFRFTFDIPFSTYRKIKAIAALSGQRIQDIAHESIKDKLENDNELNVLLKKLCMLEDN